jgi:protein SCO1/2
MLASKNKYKEESMKGIIILRIFIVAVLVVIMGTAAYIVINKAEKSRASLPEFTSVPEFNFLDQNEEVFDLNRLHGKISLVDFFFTRCKGPCTIMSSHMNQLYTFYSDNDNVQIVSISVDPEYDTFEALKQYALDQNVSDSRWNFIRNDMEHVVDLCENGFMLPAEGLPGNHSTKFALVDEAGMIRGYYSGTDSTSITQIKSDITLLSAGGQ